MNCKRGCASIPPPPPLPPPPLFHAQRRSSDTHCSPGYSRQLSGGSPTSPLAYGGLGSGHPLPPGWQSRFTRDGTRYFVNCETKRVSWDWPGGWGQVGGARWAGPGGWDLGQSWHLVIWYLWTCCMRWCLQTFLSRLSRPVIGNRYPVIGYCLSNDVILVRQASEQNDRILNAIRYFLYG